MDVKIKVASRNSGLLLVVYTVFRGMAESVNFLGRIT